MLTGLQKANDNYTYYFLSDGSAFKGGLKEINDKKYYFSKTTGRMLTGLRKTTDGSTYYFLSDGDVLKNNFETIDNKLYYFDKDGVMAKGYKNINNNRYYFDYSSGAAISGLKVVNNKLYYFDDKDYNAISGFKTLGNDTYYFHNKYSYALSGLQSFDDKLYYFDTNNYKMLKNDNITYANINFTFDNNGLCTNMSIIPEYKDDIRTNLIFNGFTKLGITYGTSAGQYRCNTFAAYCYNSVGINSLNGLKSNKQAQYVLENNKKIDFKNIKPGDLIFYNNENCNSVKNGETCNRVELVDGIKYHVHHIAIYIGDGKMIESTSSISEGVGRVKISDFNPNTTSSVYYPVLYGNIID